MTAGHETTQPPLVAGPLARLGPNVIGATGGSGTRAVAELVSRAGMYIGPYLNDAGDAFGFAAFSDRWINVYAPYRTAPPPAALEGELREDLARTFAAHLQTLDPPRPWGWKEPRSIFLLPFFHRVSPSLRFLHVIRDGRDIAFSANQNQLRKHGAAMGIPGPPGPASSIALWSRLNLEAADYGEQRLGPRYLRVRFEDLCGRPVETAGEILDFFALDADPRLAKSVVRTQASIGRWRREDPELIASLESVAGPALARFGY